MAEQSPRPTQGRTPGLTSPGHSPAMPQPTLSIIPTSVEPPKLDPLVPRASTRISRRPAVDYQALHLGRPSTVAVTDLTVANLSVAAVNGAERHTTSRGAALFPTAGIIDVRMLDVCSISLNKGMKEYGERAQQAFVHRYGGLLLIMMLPHR